MAKEKFYKIENIRSLKGINVDDEAVKEAIATCNEVVEDHIVAELSEREIVETVATCTLSGSGWTAKSNLDKFVEKCLDCGSIDDGRMNMQVTAKIAGMCIKRLLADAYLEGIEADVAKMMNKILKELENGGY